jgi:threonine/homoserine/homoserine lactone efflux protein
MNVQLYVGFVASVLILVAIPGPLVAVIASNALAYGRRHGLLTVAGAAGATVLHLMAVALGLTAAAAALGGWFDVLRLAGAVYVIRAGLRVWRAAPADLSAIPAEAKSPWATLRDGFAVALGNPKSLMFYATFFPQFLDPGLPPGPQLLLLSATLLCIGVGCDCLWALMADRFRGALALWPHLRNRITGGVMIGAGALVTILFLGAG